MKNLEDAMERPLDWTFTTGEIKKPNAGIVPHAVSLSAAAVRESVL
ncbi:MAG: hypothetical protein ACK4S4_01940 [Pyrinomonadaceae bacterium]